MSEKELIDDARRLLSERMPSGWVVERVAGQGSGDAPQEALFSFSGDGGVANGIALVEARPAFAAADVDRLLGGMTRRLRESLGSRIILLVSDFLSPRTRDRLAAEDISYVDMTGNVRLAMRMPAMFIETSGADRSPANNRRAGPPRLSGAKVGALVRFLVEVAPPYGVYDIEQATGVSRGYVSKVLSRLADDVLIERTPRGPVTAVDWPALLRVRGDAVDLFASESSRTYIAPNGARSAFSTLGRLTKGPLVVTGSFAAAAIAPVAAPALLVCYVDAGDNGTTVASVAGDLGLLPSDEGADVVLLPPSDPSIVTRPRLDGGVAFVNLPQLVVDCLSGTGRMPAEGEALLDWMQTDVDRWRYTSLDDFREVAA